jgi:hypothetical protein
MGQTILGKRQFERKERRRKRQKDGGTRQKNVS